jgi:flagellar hook-associated protein 1 FlgK
MVTGIFGMLNTGKGALLAQQTGINVTGHNISNVNTEGYSRQKVVMETNMPVSAWPGQVGTGVKAAQINRVYDSFLGIQMRDETASLGRWEAQESGLKNIDAIFNESNGYGLNQAMNEFWNSWQELSNNPSGITERNNVVEKGKALASVFCRIDGELTRAQRQADDNIKAAIGQINTLAGQIAALNKNISSAEVGGQKANDYRDQRDMLIKDLSSLIDVKTFENNNGQVNVILGSGRPLVNEASVQSLSVDTRSDGLSNIMWNDGYGTSVNITDNISGGKLKGWLELRDTDINSYLGKLDSLAGVLIDSVNTAHRNGFDLNDNTGINFWD